MIAIIEEGTARSHGMIAEWSVRTEAPGNAKYPERLEVKVFGNIDQYKTLLGELDIDDLTDPESNVAFKNHLMNQSDTMNQDFQGILVWAIPKTWAHIALDAIHNT